EDKATKAKNHKGELEAAAARLEAAEAARVKEVENLNIAHQKVIDNMKGDKAKALAVTAAVLERDLEHLKGENKGLVKQVSDLKKEIHKMKEDAALEYGVRQDLRDKLEAAQTQLKEVRTKLEKREAEMSTYLDSVSQALGHVGRSLPSAP
ncbi:unnamed protein product, partial [Symbiodinium necroappetens]